MKCFKRITFGILFAFMMMLQVNAAEVANDSDLKTCVGTTGNTCTLTANVLVDEAFDIAGTITLDLNGYTLTANDEVSGNAIFNVLRGGKLTINDSSAAKSGKITVGENTDVNAVVFLTKKGETADGEAATVIVNGGTLEGYYYALAGNGDRHNTVMEINGGTLKALNSSDNIGIYHPQKGTLTITGGTITGLTGIEIRSGVLKVTGGTIIGTGTELSVEENGDGGTTVGAGIAIAQHTTNNDISVTITGGTIQGKVALYESTPETNPAPEKVTIVVSGGNFEAINEGTTAVYSENVTGFVTGGTYNTEVEDTLVAATLTTKEENGVVYVGKESTVTVKDATNGEVKADRATAVEGQTVTLTITAAKGYKLDKVVVKDASGKEITVTDGKFVMPGSNVEVSATFVAETPITPNVPKTGDNVMLFVALGFMSIAAIAVASDNLKKRATR